MKLWDGRFSKPTDSLMDRFNNSLAIDQVLFGDDIKGSIAWAHALEKIGALTHDDTEKITTGLSALYEAYRNGSLTFEPSDEDVHMAVERLLIQKIGDPGARLHTGRSRNDQVATDFRLYVKRSLREIIEGVIDLQKTLLDRAEKDKDIIVPGYTHLQQAQPVSLGHYWLSFLFLLEREKTRCFNACQTADCMPLGSGALAGSGFAVDRDALAAELGFSRVSENSMDGVASRDFVLETLAAMSSLGIHCSRYAEDLIIWSSREFGFIGLDDAWSTGSSMMPQKKNPDSLELIRGKCGRFIGNYTRFAATLKGVGLTYCKDLQEDKEPLIDSVEQMKLVLAVFARVIETLSIDIAAITASLDPFLLATDLADYLVRKNVPFRKAHAIVGSLVKHCVEKNVALNTLPVETMKTFSAMFDADVLTVFDWKQALAGRNIQGGTGPESMVKQIEQAQKLVDKKSQVRCGKGSPKLIAREV
jgi:argininosuccinate lyase